MELKDIKIGMAVSCPQIGRDHKLTVSNIRLTGSIECEMQNHRGTIYDFADDLEPFERKTK